jgi:RNA polymerase sigma-70 factor, ECF subfamily
MEDITYWLQRWNQGESDSLNALIDTLYRELRRLAIRAMAGEGGGRTIQPTALVHEVYLQLRGMEAVEWQSGAHFLNAAAKMMRHILVDQARRRRADKRGGPCSPVDPTAAELMIEDPALNADVLSVHDALLEFSREYPRHAEVVELRFFGGLTADETAEVMRAGGREISLRTVERDWTFARAWLQNAIEAH